MQKWSCSHRQISGNILTRPQKVITGVHTDGYRSGTVKPHPSCWYLASWEYSKTSSHLSVRVCVEISINSSPMPNSPTHAASSRETQKLSFLAITQTPSKGMQWSNFGLLPMFKADLHLQSCDSEASGGTAWKSAWKICLLVVSPYLYFFLGPCSIGIGSCSGHWGPAAVWFLPIDVFFYA